MDTATFQPAILQAKNLKLGFHNGYEHEKILLQNINLNLNPGDFVCLIGPNGSGKSTLIRNLCGISNPLSGDILLEGKAVGHYSKQDLSRKLGVVLTQHDVVDQITVEEIVAIGRYAYTGWLGSLNFKNRTAINNSIRLVGLSGLENRKYFTLSDGEKQRAFIAKTLCTGAPLLILDEPTAHLDIPNRVEIMTLLRRLTRIQGCTVLVSTHELDLAMQLADEIWLMDGKGNISGESPEEIMYSGTLSRVFGNENVFFAEHSGNFCVRTEITGSLEVSGDGLLSVYTRQALQRLGFAVNDNQAERKIKIQVDETNLNWTVILNSENFSFASLSNLCRFLRHNLK